MEIHNVIIIGAGPAGIASAIQLKRQGINPLVIEKKQPGGLLLNANRIENYPGFPKGISGVKLVRQMTKQLRFWGIDIIKEEVIEVEYNVQSPNDSAFIIKTNQQTLKSNVLIIATGTKAKTVETPEIPSSVRDRIFYEVYPLLQIKNREFVVAGSGDAAFDYALNLSRKNRVHIINRSNYLKCLPILFEECSKNKNIRYSENTVIEKIEKEVVNQHDYRLSLHCLCDGKDEILKSDYLIFAVGRQADLRILGPELKNNYQILISSKRLFLTGDVQNGDYRQLSISVGDGVKAAMEIFKKYNF
ncbi:NAD(P)/FAD-dependent oxidoreductase [Bacteroidota bacterium]